MGTVEVTLLAALAPPPGRYEHVCFPTNQLDGKFRHSLGSQLGKSIFHYNVFSFDPSELVHFLPKHFEKSRRCGFGARIEITDPKILGGCCA